MLPPTDPAICVNTPETALHRCRCRTSFEHNVRKEKSIRPCGQYCDLLLITTASIVVALRLNRLASKLFYFLALNLMNQNLHFRHLANQMKNVSYPDTISIALDEVNNKVISIYSDHSIYVWDVKDIRRVKFERSKYAGRVD